MNTLFPDTELFSSGELRINKFAIPDAELTLWEHFISRAEADKIYQVLLAETPWQQQPITLHGKQG